MLDEGLYMVLLIFSLLCAHHEVKLPVSNTLRDEVTVQKEHVERASISINTVDKEQNLSNHYILHILFHIIVALTYYGNRIDWEMLPQEQTLLLAVWS